MKKMIIASTSTVHGSTYLEYILPTLGLFFKNVKQILFIPYARPSGISYDDYTQKAEEAFSKIGKTVIGIHRNDCPKEAVEKAEAIFVGGGNTFELLSQIYKNDILHIIKKVVSNGTPYLGTSAGSNICGLNIKTTNDMPIIYPSSFDALKFIPFNINPHYLDSNKNSTHMGETRETRICEFHIYNDIPVIGLREGSWLEVDDETIILKGDLTARFFEKGKRPIEIKPETILQ